MKRIKKSDIIWNYVGTVFNMGMGIILLPFLLRFLSTDELGFWYVLMSYAGVANLFTFGFTPAFSRNIAYCWNGATKLEKTEKSTESVGNVLDLNLLSEILSTSKYLYFIISIFAIIGIGTIGTIHINAISKSLVDSNVGMCWGVFLVAIFLNLFYGYYSSYIIGIGKIKESNVIIVISSIVRIVVMFVMMIHGYGLFAACIAYLIYGFAFRILGKVVFDRALRDRIKHNAQKKLPKPEITAVIKCFRIVWYNAWRDGAVSVSEYFSTQLSTIVCSSFLSLSETALFGLTSQVVGMIGKFAKSIHNAHTPVFQSSYIKGDKETLRNTQAFCVFIFIIVYVVGITALEIVGIPIIGLMKKDVKLDYLFILIYAVYQFMLSYRNCYGSYLSCTNRVIYWKSFVITSFCVVGGYTILLKTTSLGIWGIVFTCIIGEAAYNFWKWPSMVNRELNLNFLSIFRIGYSELCILLIRKGKH